MTGNGPTRNDNRVNDVESMLKPRNFHTQLHRRVLRVSTDMPHVLARVQTKKQGRCYESLKIEAFSLYIDTFTSRLIRPSLERM